MCCMGLYSLVQSISEDNLVRDRRGGDLSEVQIVMLSDNTDGYFYY